MKVFGTGMQRTGTMSLTHALNLLDVKTIQFPFQLLNNLLSPTIKQYDGFTDFPIPILYQQLDHLYPSSLFIHTKRNIESWLSSAEWLFTTGRIKFNWHKTPIVDRVHKLFYGTTQYNEKIFREKFESYNQEVIDYFSARPSDFLLFDLGAGHGYPELCAFLDKSVPELVYPHINQKEGLRRRV